MTDVNDVGSYTRVRPLDFLEIVLALCKLETHELSGILVGHGPFVAV